VSIVYKFLNWLTKTQIWKDFFEWLGVYCLRLKGYPLFQISDYFKIIDRMEQGNYYVFMSTDTKLLSSILIKGAVRFSSGTGYFSHAGHIFLDGDRNTRLLHMRSVGLVDQLAIDFLKQIDYFCIVELPIKEENKKEAQRRIDEVRKNAKFIQYDWSQDLTNGDKLLYCSELLYENFKDLVDSPNFTPRMMFGRWIFDPDILLDCGKIIYSNHPDFPAT